jgi:hypothetical protein
MMLLPELLQLPSPEETLPRGDMLGEGAAVEEPDSVEHAELLPLLLPEPDTLREPLTVPEAVPAAPSPPPPPPPPPPLPLALGEPLLLREPEGEAEPVLFTEPLARLPVGEAEGLAPSPGDLLARVVMLGV